MTTLLQPKRMSAQTLNGVGRGVHNGVRKLGGLRLPSGYIARWNADGVDSIGKSSATVQPGRAYTGACTVAITGLLTTDTILADSTDQPTCSVNGTLTIGAGAVVYGVSISRASVQVGYYPCAEGAGYTCLNAVTGVGALPDGIISVNTIHTELRDGSGFDLNLLGFSNGRIISNKLINSQNFNLTGWVKGSALTYDASTDLLSRTSTDFTSIRSGNIAIASTSVKFVIRAKAGTNSVLTVMLFDPITSGNKGKYSIPLTNEWDDYSIYADGLTQANGIKIYIYLGTDVDTSLTNLYISDTILWDYATESDSIFSRHIVTGSAALDTVITRSPTPTFSGTVLVGDSVFDSSVLSNYLRGITPFARVTESAVGGTGMATIKSTFAANVSGKSAVFIQGGTNDFLSASSNPSAAVLAYLDWMVDHAVDNGILPIICTISPFGGSITYWTTEKQGWLDAHNQLRVAMATQYGVPLFDLYAVLVGADGISIAASYDNGDGIHPNDTGKLAMAYAMRSTMLAEISLIDLISDTDRDTFISCTTTNNTIDQGDGYSLQYPGRVKYSLLEPPQWPSAPEIIEILGVDNAVYDSDGVGLVFATPALALAALETLADDTQLFVGPKGAALYSIDMSAEADKINRYLGNSV